MLLLSIQCVVSASVSVSTMDEQRALLDQLMGTTRDLSEIQKDQVHKIRFSDSNVCKNYLCGLCPYVAFAATKSDMGKCDRQICNSVEADVCRDEWNTLSQKEKERHGYERGLLHTLENIVKSCDRKIDKQKQRTDQDMLMSQEDIQRIFLLNKQISDRLTQCEVYGEDGNIDRSFEIMKYISQLQENVIRIANPSDEKRNIVCETSGNYMSSRDNDERMRAHFEGKQYLGWKLVREKYRDLMISKQSTSRNYDRSPARYSNYSSSSRGDRRERGDYGHRDRGRDRDRDSRGYDDRSDRKYRDRSRERRSGDVRRRRSRERDSSRGRS